MSACDAQGIHLTAAEVTVSGTCILADVSLALTERRIGIVGRNGSGKTTLMRLMSGLIAPSAGKVRVAGIDPAADRKAAVRKIGILFQNPDHQILFPLVEEELAFGLRQLGQTQDMATARARTLLAAEGRAIWASAPTATLSQGQRHYLCLLSVLLMAPDTILLDEPFAGMDLPTQARLTRRLLDIPQQVITISHDPRHLAGSDRVIWLEQGRVKMDGLAAVVLAEFTTEMARIGGQDADIDLTG